MTEVLRKDNNIYVKSYYDNDFVIAAKQINGKWENPYWVFDEENMDLVEKIVLKHYGYKLGDDIVKIEYKAEDFTYENLVIVGTKKTVERRRRRTPVNLFDTIVVSGGFNNWSGSERNPQLGTDYGTVLRTTISKSFLNMLTDEEKSKIKVIETKLKKDELLQEKERLEKRLIEIDMLLKQFEN